MPTYSNVNDFEWWGDISRLGFKNEESLQIISKQIRCLSFTNINDAIRQFIGIEFSYLSCFPEYIEYIGLERSLKTIILWDRYNKKEDIISGLDFTALRNVLNKFNTRHLINFFSEHSYAFLYIHYYEFFAKNDISTQKDVEPAKLRQEMLNLYQEANKYTSLQLDSFRTFLTTLRLQAAPISEEGGGFSLFDENLD